MPRKPSKNGFIVFTRDWRSKYGNHLTLSEATTECGKIWGTMTAQERAPYNERAKMEKINSPFTARPKLTCTGRSLEEVEREREEAERRERCMKRTIEMTVRNSVKNCQMKSQPYYFLTVNYFTRSISGAFYLPAEISVAKYSLEEGVCRAYHSFLNPGTETYGSEFMAKHHADNTHQLPLPPHAKGETDLGLVYNNILDFIRDSETGEYPPVYTHRDSIPVVSSVLCYMKTYLAARNVDLEIYSIQYLLYILKETAMKINGSDKLISSYITDADFERDFFEYQTGIACTYHEEIDKSKYCTKSSVIRWGYMFSDSLCGEVAVDLIPGRHVPVETNLEAIVNPAPSTNADTESQISVNSESTYATKAVAENKIYYDDQNAHTPARANNTGRSSLLFVPDDFPTLGPGSSRKKPGPIVSSAPTKSSRMNTIHQNIVGSSSPDSTIDINPWSLRSRNVPREPDTSHFDINYTRDETTDSDSSTPVGYGRGRRRNNVSPTSTVTAGSGRGKLFQRLNK